MTEKPKQDAQDTQGTQNQQPPQRTSSAARGKKSGGDARGNEEKLHENQRRLGVGGDHKTADMKKNHRGTFP